MAAPSIAAALDGLLAKGFARVDVPVLLGMDDFVKISGEEFRRRIFVTTDNSGNDFCLRPEFTIPVVRQAVESGHPEGMYCYSGRVFLNGTAVEPKEQWQLGAEIIGDHETAAADRTILAHALATLADFGIDNARVRFGDIGLFRALLASLNVPPAWARRLTLAYGNPKKVHQTLDHMGDQPTTFSSFSTNGDVVEALARFPSEKVGALFAEVLAVAGVRTVGGRTPAEIAERVVEQATLAAGGLIPDEHADIIRKLLAIEGSPGAVTQDLHAIAGDVDGPFAKAVSLFERRIDGFDPSAVFSGGFGRELGYYDGFVFDLTGEDGTVLAGGGRYDETAARLTGRTGIKGIGFAIFPGRIAGMAE